MRTVCISQRGVGYVHATLLRGAVQTLLRGAAQLASDAEN